MSYFPNIEDITKAATTIARVAVTTPLTSSERYSQRMRANILLKREDLQPVRSYKIRGAFNKIASLSERDREKGIVCASAGNHAQGVAFACRHLGIHGTIFMPAVTPQQKIEQTQMFGGDSITIELTGDTYDDAYTEAMAMCQETGKVFVHPFDDPKTIEGQATVGLEILQQTMEPVDYVLAPIGGGGLVSGLCATFHALSPETKIIGVEPSGAPSMQTSLANGKNTELTEIDKFVDGAAVKKVGDFTFEICKHTIERVLTVDEGEVCETILELYNKDAIVVEPAGALTIAALRQLGEDIIDKNVVCIISGSNNDITRTAEIKERALLYAQLKHYFIVRFPQRPGALKRFVVDVLGENDDITHFEYSKKSSRDAGPAVVGIQLKDPNDLTPLISRMKAQGFFGDYLNDKPDLFQYLV